MGRGPSANLPIVYPGTTRRVSGYPGVTPSPGSPSPVLSPEKRVEHIAFWQNQPGSRFRGPVP
eukprot:2532898-Rhodomonas_salina.1